MEILNIGPLELILFLVIAFVLLGPKDMILTAYRIGQWVRKIIRSPLWREILRSAQEIREFPTKIMDETGLKQELEILQQETKATFDEVNTEIKEATRGAELKVEIDRSLLPTSISVPLEVATPQAAYQTLPQNEPEALPSPATTEDIPAELLAAESAVAESQEPDRQADQPASLEVAQPEVAQPEVAQPVEPYTPPPAVFSGPPVAGVFSEAMLASPAAQPADEPAAQPAVLVVAQTGDASDYLPEMQEAKPVRKRATRKKEGANGSDQQVVTEGEEPAPVRKRTTRKKAETPPEATSVLPTVSEE